MTASPRWSSRVCGDPSLIRPSRRRSAAVAAALGLALLAAAPAGAANNPGTGDTGFFTFRPSPGIGGTQINVASGNALIRTQDLADTAGNYHVVVDRAYNSLTPDTFSILTPRWAFDVGPATGLTVESNQDVTVTGPSGYRIRFARQSDGSYVPPTGFGGTLTKTSSGWTLDRTSQGDQFVFDSNGQLTMTRDAAARDFTVQGTSAAGRTVLSSYGTSSGRRVNLSYTGDSLVREMDDPSSGHHYYRYTDGRLTQYEAPNGAITAYRYDSNGRLDKITEPGGTTVELATTAGGRVSSITSTLPGGVPQTTSFVYTRRPYKTDVTGPEGVRRTYAYDDDYRVTRQYNPDIKPVVTASGELRDLDGEYTRGVDPVPVTVSAAEPDGSGLTHLAAEEAGGAEIAQLGPQCSDSPFDHVCPTTYSGETTADLSGLPSGKHDLRATARDDEGNTGASASWSILIDRTAPAIAGTFDAIVDEGDGNADLSWTPASDPDLPTGEPGSGFDRYEVRTRPESGTWPAFAPVADSSFPTVELGSHQAGDRIDYEVKAYDKLGNVSTYAGTATVALTDVTSDDEGDLAPGESTQPVGPVDTGEDDAWRDVDPDEEIDSAAPEDGASSAARTFVPQQSTAAERLTATAASSYHHLLCGDDGLASPCGTYSGRAAAEYAREFALTDHGAKRNHDYTYYDSDCTNFASQVLHFGGMRFSRTAGVNDPRHDDNDLYVKGPGSWWSQKYENTFGQTKYRNSTSWSVGWVLYNQLVDHGLARVVSHERLHSGDIIFYWWKGRTKISDINHVNVIAGVRKRQVFVAQHAKDRLETLRAWDIRARGGNPNMDRVVLRPTATAFDLP